VRFEEDARKTLQKLKGQPCNILSIRASDSERFHKDWPYVSTGVALVDLAHWGPEQHMMMLHSCPYD